MKKNCLSAFIFSLLCGISFSQKINSHDFKILIKKEDSLKVLSAQIIGGINAADRLKADSIFTRMLVRALKIPNSFYYPFDSLISVSKLVPPDSSFKIFTWQMNINDEVTRQHGAIQMNTKDGVLNLLPLIDKSDVITDVVDTVADNYGWIGAVYYKIIERQASGKNYYTLLGYDENNIRSNKKIIEILTFDNGKPLFGGPYFNFENDSKSRSRFVLEYKKNAGPRLTYDDDLDMIVYEHLISETNEPQKKYTYIPDGDYEGLQWKNGKWMHIEKVFTQQLKEGQEPVPSPILDDKGNIDETRLKNADGEETDTSNSVSTDKPSGTNTKTSAGKNVKRK